jgi:hypothetical protein
VRASLRNYQTKFETQDRFDFFFENKSEIFFENWVMIKKDTLLEADTTEFRACARRKCMRSASFWLWPGGCALLVGGLSAWLSSASDGAEIVARALLASVFGCVMGLLIAVLVTIICPARSNKPLRSVHKLPAVD